MYQPFLLNRFSQFGKTYYDLLLQDDEKILPDYRETIKVADKDDTEFVIGNIMRLVTERVTDQIENPPVKPPTTEEKLQALEEENATLKEVMTRAAETSAARIQALEKENAELKEVIAKDVNDGTIDRS